MVHVAISCDDACWRFAAATACGAVKGCSLPVAVHLIDGGVADAHWDEFCAAVAKLKSGVVCRWHRSEADSALPLWRGSRITWPRLFLHEMLSDVAWVVPADADVLFSCDVAALCGTKVVIYDAAAIPESVEGFPDAIILHGADKSPEGFLRAIV